jgi:hypothetical protein
VDFRGFSLNSEQLQNFGLSLIQFEKFVIPTIHHSGNSYLSYNTLKHFSYGFMGQNQE